MLQQSAKEANGNDLFVQAQTACRPGVNVLAYQALREGGRTADVFQVECSIVELRLRMLGAPASPDLLDLMYESLSNQAPTKDDMQSGAADLAQDHTYFTIVFHAATTIERIHRRQGRLENRTFLEQSDTVSTLRNVANINGWLPAP